MCVITNNNSELNSLKDLLSAKKQTGLLVKSEEKKEIEFYEFVKTSKQ